MNLTPISSSVPLTHPQYDLHKLLQQYQTIRKATEQLCEPLEYDDHLVQSAEFVSPPKWHLGHTAWFFETFLLSRFLNGYREFHPKFSFIFNSYYQAVGQMHQRDRRGILSRPTLSEVFAYRKFVDDAMEELLVSLKAEQGREVTELVELGIHHEQQHQELMLMDIKHIFSHNPLMPAYLSKWTPGSGAVNPQWVGFGAGARDIGAHLGFHYDNEGPRHRVFLGEFEISTHLVTNGEYLEFMQSGGYRCPEYWFADGWDWVEQNKVSAPLYWLELDGRWHEMTLSGVQVLADDLAVSHVSFYEAAAFARWAGKRLPTEAEWEVASGGIQIQGNFLEKRHLHPVAVDSSQSQPIDGTYDIGIHQMFGDVWEWTSSAYSPYPGYKCRLDAIGEYNGKFMINQMVLKGGSSLTPQSHIRASYRNFFQPAMRWPMCGFRLAR